MKNLQKNIGFLKLSFIWDKRLVWMSEVPWEGFDIQIEIPELLTTEELEKIRFKNLASLVGKFFEFDSGDVVVLENAENWNGKKQYKLRGVSGESFSRLISSQDDWKFILTERKPKECLEPDDTSLNVSVVQSWNNLPSKPRQKKETWNFQLTVLPKENLPTVSWLKEVVSWLEEKLSGFLTKEGLQKIRRTWKELLEIKDILLWMEVKKGSLQESQIRNLLKDLEEIQKEFWKVVDISKIDLTWLDPPEGLDFEMKLIPIKMRLENIREIVNFLNEGRLERSKQIEDLIKKIRLKRIEIAQALATNKGLAGIIKRELEELWEDNTWDERKKELEKELSEIEKDIQGFEELAKALEDFAQLFKRAILDFAGLAETEGGDKKQKWIQKQKKVIHKWRVDDDWWEES